MTWDFFLKKINKHDATMNKKQPPGQVEVLLTRRFQDCQESCDNHKMQLWR